MIRPTRFAWQVATGYAALPLVSVALHLKSANRPWLASIILPRLGIFHASTRETNLRGWHEDWCALNYGETT